MQGQNIFLRHVVTPKKKIIKGKKIANIIEKFYLSMIHTKTKLNVTVFPSKRGNADKEQNLSFYTSFV